MKVIAVERMWNGDRRIESEALGRERVSDPRKVPMTLIADSAVVRRGMPLFVPDFAMDWVLEIVPAVVICRLGKSIPVRFAHRYYREIGVMGRLVPKDGLPEGALACGFDGALCMGGFYGLPDDGVWSVIVDGKEELTLGREELGIDECVALVSRYMMLKTGDIIIPCRTGLRVGVELGIRVAATLNGEKAMGLKIK